MLARLGKAVRTVGRMHSRSFVDSGNPNLSHKSGYLLPGSQGETDSLGANSETKFGRKTNAPPYNPYEFTPYKVERERYAFLSGYSFEEAYNLQQPSKTSKVVKASMYLDNVVIGVILVLIVIMAMERHREHRDYQAAYAEYMEGQLSLERDLVIQAHRNSTPSETHN
jgi:hypothetical protein